MRYEGDCIGPDFSIEFYADATGTIQGLGVVLRGTTKHSESLIALLTERYGWILTHP